MIRQWHSHLLPAATEDAAAAFTEAPFRPDCDYAAEDSEGQHRADPGLKRSPVGLPPAVPRALPLRQLICPPWRRTQRRGVRCLGLMTVG